MNIFLLIFLAIIVINTIAAVITVFRQPRNIAATWAWLLVLILIPVVGFIIYSFFGRRLPKNQLVRLSDSSRRQVDQVIKEQKQELAGLKGPGLTTNQQIIKKAAGLIEMFMNSDTAPLLSNNEVETYTDGEPFFKQFFADLEAAESSINIEFYTFYADKIGHQTLDLLVKKAQAGVDVRVIYDDWGSLGTTQKFFKPLLQAGGHAFPFLHNRFNLLDMRVNFRDHHKVVVIDGKYGYIGGFNIGDQYLGRKPKFGNWRDGMIRIYGKGVYGLQSRFLLDWNGTDPTTAIDPNLPVQSVKYFPEIETQGAAMMQIVSSGPDPQLEQIKTGYIKMISLAEHSIKITTPYLIPDSSVLDALKIAVQSGVDVQIVTPNMPDHPFVYRATQYYSRRLVELGIKVYAYNQGFIHAKTVVVDGEIVSVGSANLDYRSFELNFECNAFIYDKELADQFEAIFAESVAASTPQTTAVFASQSHWLNFKQHFSRLLSPLL
ncbi:cardiolipin synthase [Fructilactobacillus florum]|uniref:cardiolipin synthase n=1 Tax=Fructilactobacillus florum TaxID=640331 RepID=UPI00028EFDF2|nr:cardiolipin synthase [Fructilactobacillus florum]EKK21015.1 Cardiolipin synthetase [Fructilactobacillus florum 2F]